MSCVARAVSLKTKHQSDRDYTLCLADSTYEFHRK